MSSRRERIDLLQDCIRRAVKREVPDATRGEMVECVLEDREEA
jgi:hypothetical protein